MPNMSVKRKLRNQPDEDLSDFEEVPQVQNNSDDDDDGNDEDDEGNVDIFGSLMTTNLPKRVVKSKQAAETRIDFLADSEGDDDEDFIAHENQAAKRKKKKSGGFQSMGLSHPIFKAVLHKGFKVPTPIQRKTVPIIMQGLDVVAMARTGSGKTAAFLIPMLEKLKSHSAKVGARAIILSPSRELAMQTQKVTTELGKYTDLRSCILVGGDNLEDQFGMMASNPDILIATPGRLLHLIVEMDLELKTVEYVVFDEADRLFEMGFSVQLHELLSRLPSSRQTLLFSATLPKLLVDFAKAGLQVPTLVRLDVDTKISRDLEMAFFSVKQIEKEAALLYLLRSVIKVPFTTGVPATDLATKSKKSKSKSKIPADASIHQTIIFTSTKHHVEYISTLLSAAGYQVSYVYGSLDQTARIIQINNFRNGRTNILVVTDVAARGIDIPVLENVINYDFVDSSKVFIHRVGRTARAGRRGWAYSFVTLDELPYLLDLQLFLARPLLMGPTLGNRNPDYTTEVVLGTLPRDLMESDLEWVKQKLSNDLNIEGLQGVARNGYKLYTKSRPNAAQESYTRAKEVMQADGYSAVHPLFGEVFFFCLLGQERFSQSILIRWPFLLSNVDPCISFIKTFLDAIPTADLLNTSDEKERVDLVTSISKFRPQETIFEVGQRGARKASAAFLVMKQRRQTADKVIEMRKASKKSSFNAVGEDGEPIEKEDLGEDVGEKEIEAAFNTKKRKRDDADKTAHPAKKKKSNNFRDEAFYMSHYQADANTEKGYSMSTSGSFIEQASTATVDMQGDERDTMRQKQNILRWDARKKKFVRGTGIGADNKKLITTESGTKISASFKSGRYTDWTHKSKLILPRTGEQELASSKTHAGAKRYRHQQQKEAKPLDPLAHDYERKAKRRQMGDENGEEAGKGGAGEDRGKRQKDGRVKGKRTVGGRGTKSELKNVDQIRKERKMKENRKAKNARSTKKKGKGRGGRNTRR
ncbi:P-loop containing nucleoside triphosphate hydrolase protein [Jimgerdemannia flammicorona]|uniref:RNA helicase n=1 Tax=Jimgerdemannia flammicorona TaxID=994334 RepID=A0A433Q7W9_9FUNG|nr:P-loop containing nucleoside triphosphate hydrolase protein [Jimgerdemannia flammicorona]